MEIITNNRPRDFLYWCELSDKEKREFDYLDSDEKRDSAEFFRYKGRVYDVGEFMRIPNYPEGPDQWGEFDGYSSDSYFSGVLIRFVERGERVIVARYLC